MVQITKRNHNGDLELITFEDGHFARYEKDHECDLIVRNVKQQILASYEHTYVAHIFAPLDK